MEVAVKVALVRHAFGRAYATGISEVRDRSLARTGRHGDWNYR